MVLSYKTIPEQTLLEISPAVKNPETNKWDCKIKYQDKLLTFNTPRVNIKDGVLFFDIKKKKIFLDFLEKIDQTIVNCLFDNCEKIFKGKKFTLERLKNSLQPQLDIDENGTVSLSTTFDDNVKFFNTFGDQINPQDIGDHCSANICVEKVIFTKDLFRIKYTIKVLKSSRIEKNNENFDEPIKSPPENIENNGEADNFFD
jgi:hypothetical protein